MIGRYRKRKRTSHVTGRSFKKARYTRRRRMLGRRRRGFKRSPNSISRRIEPNFEYMLVRANDGSAQPVSSVDYIMVADFKGVDISPTAYFPGQALTWDLVKCVYIYYQFWIQDYGDAFQNNASLMEMFWCYDPDSMGRKCASISQIMRNSKSKRCFLKPGQRVGIKLKPRYSIATFNGATDTAPVRHAYTGKNTYLDVNTSAWTSYMSRNGFQVGFFGVGGSNSAVHYSRTYLFKFMGKRNAMTYP